MTLFIRNTPKPIRVFKKSTPIIIFAVVATLTLLSFIMNREPKATYKITSENGKTYYSNTFRIYGRGIVFDDIQGRTIIVQGDLEIVKQTKNE